MNPGSIEAKKQNIVRIAKAIYDHPEVSRKELGQRFGLSASTVTLAVNALLEQQLVEESSQEESVAGRKARLLRVNPRFGSILTIQLAGDLSIQFRLSDLCGQRLAAQDLPAPAALPSPQAFPALLAESASAFLAEPAGQPPLAAAAVIIPGVMNPDGTADLPVLGWEALDLRVLSEALQVPVYCDTVIHMLGGYEVRQLPVDGRQIYLSLEPGVGMSVYEQGQPAASRNLLYGEVGHISMHEDGPPCYCGNRGCLEYYCGVTGILSRLAALADACPIIARLTEHGPALEHVTQAARLGSAAAQQLLQSVSVELGRALVTICNILDPDQILVSGRLWQLPEIREPALALARDRLLSKKRRQPAFLSAALPPDQYEIGTCHYVFNRLIESLL